MYRFDFYSLPDSLAFMWPLSAGFYFRHGNATLRCHMPDLTDAEINSALLVLDCAAVR